MAPVITSLLHIQPHNTALNACIIRLWFQWHGKIYYSAAIFLSVCTLPWPCYFICWFLFSECMLSICYSNSCYNSWPIGLMFYWEWVKKKKRRWQKKKKKTRQECILIKTLFSNTLMAWHWCICIEMNYTGLAWRDF